MKAIILAGGKGTRLAPYTTVFPKPMLPVGDRPILEIIIAQLAYYGFMDVVLSVGYCAQLIQAYFQNGHTLPDGVTLSYVREDEPLGTAGSVALVPNLTESFLVMNGDVLTTLDYAKLFAFHREKGGLLTVGVHKKKMRVDLGVVDVTEDQQITHYAEKPTYTFLDGMGIYVYEPEVTRYIEPGAYLDLPSLVSRLIDNKEKVYAYFHDKPHYWIDIGQHEDYEKANKDFVEKRGEFLPGNGEVSVPISELEGSRTRRSPQWAGRSAQPSRPTK